MLGPVLESMIAELAALYRVVREDEIGVGARATYVGDDHYELCVTTDVTDVEYCVTYLEDEPRHTLPQGRGGGAVRILLDGSLVRTTEWRRDGKNWHVMWASPAGPVQISTNGARCPEVLNLVTITAADLAL